MDTFSFFQELSSVETLSTGERFSAVAREFQVLSKVLRRSEIILRDGISVRIVSLLRVLRFTLEGSVLL